MNIRVDLNAPIKDGMEVVFRSPVDCSQITGLIVYFREDGKTSSKEFVLADAHGNNVGDIDHLFAENVVVKVILDVTTGMAFVQNADTNAYIEKTFVKTVNGIAPDENGNVKVAGGSGGNVDLTGYATEQFVRDGFQPKGEYLTSVPEGYAKTKDIPTKPEEIGADPKGAAASAVAQHNTATGSHNDIRLELKSINDRLTAFFDSDNQTLDELSEIVAYITSNKTLIDSITTSKVSVADIINNLTTNVSNKPLSAAQGVALKALIDALTSGKLDATALPTAINTALAQAKASGEFDGKDGQAGKDGSAGSPGADGFSPTVDVSKSGKVTTISITDKSGTKTATINDGADGSAGAAGKDGTSVTHSWSGTTLNISSASGTSSANLKGEKGDKGDSIKGDKGDTGAAGTSVTVKSVSESTADGGSNVVTFSDGKTVTIKNGSKGSTGANGTNGKIPVKGTDYWTAADKESMIQDVISALGGSPIFGVVDSNNNIVITGNLADGVYTLKYEDAEGVQTDIGTLTLAPEVTYTNLFDPATATINTRMSGSSKAPKTENGYVMTAAINIPAQSVAGSSVAGTSFVTVPASMWSGSANMFLGSTYSNVDGMCDANTTKGEVVGTWVKIPIVNQWSNALTCTNVTLSLKVSGSAITSSDIQNIEIYFNEIPK